MYLKSKRISILVLAAFLISVFMGFGNLPASAATTPSDVYSSWAYLQISSLLNEGTISGYPDGTFKPDNTISRAEFMSMVNRAYGFNTTAPIAFSDVNASDWFYADVAKASAAGYISGYTDGTMKPNQNIERQEAAVIIAKVAKLSSEYAALPFVDAGSIPTWSWMSISAMVKIGLLSGYPDGTFKPAASVTRAEASAMLYNALHKAPVGNKVTGVSLSETTLDMDKGDTQTLTANVNPSTAANQTVTWSSDNTSVATVSSTGKVTAKANGTATITVTTVDGDFTDTCEVTVGSSDNSAGSVTLNDDEDDQDSVDLDVEPGDKAKIRVYLPSGYHGDDVDESDIDWNTDDDDDVIADIDYNSYGDDDKYIVFTVDTDNDNEGEATISFEIDVDGDTYYAEAVINVEDSSDSDSTSGSVDLTDDEDNPDSVNIDIDTDESATVKVYLPDDYEASDIDDIYWYTDDDDDVISNIVQEDYDDEDYYVKFTIESSYMEGDATIHFEIDVDGEPYYADVDLGVGSSSGASGSVGLDDDEDDQDTLSIDMATNDSATIKVNLPDDYLGSDVSGIVWDIDDDEDNRVIYDFITEGYDDEDDFINFRIESTDEEGEATIDLIIQVNEVDYYAEVEINVND